MKKIKPINKLVPSLVFLLLLTSCGGSRKFKVKGEAIDYPAMDHALAATRAKLSSNDLKITIKSERETKVKNNVFGVHGVRKLVGEIRYDAARNLSWGKATDHEKYTSKVQQTSFDTNSSFEYYYTETVFYSHLIDKKETKQCGSPHAPVNTYVDASFDQATGFNQQTSFFHDGSDYYAQFQDGAYKHQYNELGLLTHVQYFRLYSLFDNAVGANVNYEEYFMIDFIYDQAEIDYVPTGFSC